MAGSDITVEILKDIRDAVRATNDRLDTVEATLERRFDGVDRRFAVVESTLVDLAEQHRFLVRYTKAMAERDARLEPRVSALENRVDKLESK